MYGRKQVMFCTNLYCRVKTWSEGTGGGVSVRLEAINGLYRFVL